MSLSHTSLLSPDTLAPSESRKRPSNFTPEQPSKSLKIDLEKVTFRLKLTESLTICYCLGLQIGNEKLHSVLSPVSGKENLDPSLSVDTGITQLTALLAMLAKLECLKGLVVEVILISLVNISHFIF